MSYFFAWCNSTDTVFGHEFERTDEYIFSFERKHDEGQIPTLELVIKNPRVGLLGPGRQVWAWFSHQDDATLHTTPLFFGVLVGIPTNLFAETITLKFIARSHDFIQNKQAFAETLKVRPYWDPVFLDEKHRDDPDSILEGWSSLWHIDPVTLAITASDILTGEDGTVTFEQSDAFYDSVSMTLGEAPLTNVQVQATVNWTQRGIGYIGGPNVNILSYTGQTFMSDWPKPGTSLGGGWHVESSFVTDVYKVAQTPQASSATQWNSSDPTMDDCSTSSMSMSSSYPALLSPNPISFVLTWKTQSGICDPDADPPVNRPMTLSSNGEIVPLWALNCTWGLRYDYKREYSEYLFFDLTVNAQSLLTSPLVAQNTEVITISGSNVGQPLIELKAWSDFSGQAVDVARMIFPNNPTTPGGLSYQVCVVAGIAGDVEPVFSDIPGTVTIDGSVHWASMGKTALLNQPAWSDSTFISLGEIIYYVGKTFNTAGGDWEDQETGIFLLCIGAGETNSIYRQFTYVPPQLTSDDATAAPIVVNFIPGPSIGGVSWSYPGSGAVLGDGTVTWLSLGATPAMFGIPIGGTPTEVPANNYFPTARGLWSVEHLICKARARLRLRGRAVKVGWDCPIELAMPLTCQMNATLYDPRLPGAVATGKIISVSIKGDNGKFIGHVEIGCPIGYGNSVSEITGTPEYTVGTGYMQPGYQQYDGGIVTLGDVGYTPPEYEPFDDGLIFPLASLPGVGTISGSVSQQTAAIQAAIPVTQELAAMNTAASETQTATGATGSVSVSGVGSNTAWWLEQLALNQTSHSLPYVMEANAVSYALVLKPVTNGPFNGAYGLNTIPLEIPKGINLEALSSP